MAAEGPSAPSIVRRVSTFQRDHRRGRSRACLEFKIHASGVNKIAAANVALELHAQSAPFGETKIN